MFRGMTKFVCDECGHEFSGMDCEYRCTVLTAPVRCPKCGSWHTYPIDTNGPIIRFLDFLIPKSHIKSYNAKAIYQSIWEDIDAYNTKEQENKF